jgi:hypothetical protein
LIGLEGIGGQEDHMDHDGRPRDDDPAPADVGTAASGPGRTLWGTLEGAIASAERRLEAERKSAARRAVQLAREQAYHRLAVALDRPAPDEVNPGQLSLFVVEDTLFDDAG